MENGHSSPAGESAKKSKKLKVAEEAVAMENGGDSAKKSKKVKVDDEGAAPAPDSEKKKKKKDKGVEVVNGAAAEAEVVRSSKKKRAKSPEDDAAASKKIQKVVENGGKENGAAANPMAVSNFNIGKVLREKLKANGIETLFPIQAQTFDAVFTGNDMVGRARTGQVGFWVLVLVVVCFYCFWLFRVLGTLQGDLSIVNCCGQ